MNLKGEMPSTKKTVLLTGFGPFGGHRVNASWVAVQHLAKIGLGDNINLIVKEIPVDYQSAKTLIPVLWKEHNPDLVVHVGVSGMATELTLEQQAHNDGYSIDDISGSCPETSCCVEGADCCISSEINMDSVCKEINNKECKVTAVLSYDAGRYLCDFSYFISLYIDRSRSAFIHVPMIDKPYSTDDLAEGLKVAVLSMLRQIS